MKNDQGPDDQSIANVIATVNQHSTDIRQIKDEISEILKGITDLSQRFHDRINSATAPNFGHIWAAAGVVTTLMIGVGGMALSFIVGVGSLVVTHQSREMSRMEAFIDKLDSRHATSVKDQEARALAGIKEMDIKLQREQVLMSNEIKIAAEQYDKSSRERHQHAIDRLNNLASWVTTDAHDEMNELRQRRLNAASQK